MRGKKDFLAKLFYLSGVCSLADFWNKNDITVINYHRIKASQDSHFTLFDEEVFGPNQQEFSSQLKWLVKNREVLSEDDLIAIVGGKYKPQGRSVIITFDDGYVDNYTLAYPILRQYHVPAIFFIPTQAIEERQLGWWDIFAYLLKTTKRNEIVFEGKTLYPKCQLQEAMHFVLHFIYQNKLEVSVVLKRLMVACDVDIPDQDIQGRELMSWGQLKEMSNNGMAIGAHTHSHKVLSSLNIGEQKIEIEKSKIIIEDRLNINVKSMSYPVGSYSHFSDDTKKIVLDAGYDLSFSFLTGINAYRSIASMDVKRISVSNYFPRFIGELSMPAIFCDCV